MPNSLKTLLVASALLGTAAHAHTTVAQNATVAADRCEAVVVGTGENQSVAYVPQAAPAAGVFAEVGARRR